VEVTATTQSPFETDADTIAIGVFEDEGVAHDLPGDQLMALLDSGEAQRKFKRLAVTHSQGRRIILVGLGDRTKFDGERARVAAGIVQARAAELSTKTLCWEVPHHVGDEVVAGLVHGTALRAYRFDRYKKAEDPNPFERLILSAHHDVSETVRAAEIIARAQNRARDLGNTPANDLPPSALADYAAELASRHGIEATILDEDAIRELGMGAFASVAQGSAQSARLIRLDYEGPRASEIPRLGLIGKAVTFDSGGLSLKPAASMYDMKFDMCGGAAVIETVAALAELQAPVRVMGVVGATENLPGPSAVKPGDIVRAMDGTTIEINNTDAEGRLVLSDCITYALREGCERLVDIATLTGAVVTALGRTYAGLMSNDDDWARTVETSGSDTGELLWRLPLHDDYAQMVKGRYAELTNLTERREASSITAAELLHHFAGDVPWAHLDIAGTAWDVRKPYLGREATGFGVRLMVEIARRLAEDQTPSS
jgi:leucyl aminopeptidase